RDGDYRRSYHDVLRVWVPLPLGEYHLEDGLPVAGVHVDVELVHRPQGRDYPALEREHERDEGHRPLASALRVGVEDRRLGSLEADEELEPRLGYAARIVEPYRARS